ncbi:hypothetical protein [Mycolicibacterium vanbaalenii]|uniref:Uncharacterized protein n=1 Tax=Mycolicibacterium vanbaalenii (strain DSM 7251 / JCM 13017 / BCRC 16820 / KCTC 9966 / NRRL B-24157 / PYR-1) TaxID=350058 RepID=A1TB49_MYCVP|nr:hypothetical protein [Mycolicibacterium vanbaalenii]ABM14399.1 hypothetical protein Mvan_3607 [Mycolicibacterium vanbaalenii PYR-1]MCV7126450.1 hypothetical protein [Mycolicibacterium vanbaalenii PYR-1]
MPEIDKMLDRSRLAVRENLAKIIDGDATLNDEKVVQLTMALGDVVTVMGEAYERLQKNLSEFSERAATTDDGTEAQQIDTVRDEIVNLMELLNDSVVVAPDVYQKDGTIQFHLGQIVRTSALDNLTGITKARVDRISQPGDKSLIDELNEFAGVVAGFKNAEIDTAIQALEDLDATDNRARVSLGVNAKARAVDRRAARVGEIETLAEKQLRNINVAAQGVGAQRLAKDFEDGSKREARRAAWWTFAVFACVTIGVGLPVAILSMDTRLLAQLTGDTGLLIKALIGLPLFGVAGYCARIASQHRKTASHLGLLTTQMDSVNAYVADLPDEYRHQLIMILGRRAFSNPELQLHTDEGSSNLMSEDVISVLGKAVDAARESVRRGSQ